MLRPRFNHWRTGASLFRLISICAALTAIAYSQTDGSLRWPSALTTGVRNAQIWSSPAVDAEGTLYIGLAIDTEPPGGKVFAIRRDGTEKWQSLLLPEAVESSPALSDDGTTLYVGCMDGKLYAFDLANGDLRWAFATGPRNYIFSSPAIGADGTIYVGAGDLIMTGVDSGLYAITRDGRLRWRKTTGQMPDVAHDWVESSPAIGADGTIHFGSLDQHIYAVAPDGSEKWRFRADSQIWGSPAIGPDGTVYIGSLTGRLYAISRDGMRKWEFETGGSILGGPAIGADGAIFFGSLDWSIYALEPDGTVRWTTSLGAPIFSTPAVRADGSIIVGGDDRRVHALAPDNGRARWSMPTSHNIQSSPVVADRTIYVAALDGLIYALHSTASPLSSYSVWPMFNGGPRHRGRVRAPLDGGRLVNLSTRADVGDSSNLIAGFVVRGATSKHYLIRAIGPTLAQFAVPNPLPDPTVTVRRQQTGEVVPRGFNDNWSDEMEGPPASRTAAELGAFALPAGSKDAALVSLLDPQAYTAVVGSADGQPGAALVEVYDAREATPGAVLVNLSTRGHVAAGGNIIPGLVIRETASGGGPLRLLVRAVGPGLARFGVSGVLARPTMAVFREQNIIRTNTGWTSGGLQGDLAGAARRVGAFPLDPNSADSAMLIELNPGVYTIPITGFANTAGEVLVEVYLAP